MAYKHDIINGFKDALNARFNLNSSELNVLNCTKLKKKKNWPLVDSPDLKG